MLYSPRLYGAASSTIAAGNRNACLSEAKIGPSTDYGGSSYHNAFVKAFEDLYMAEATNRWGRLKTFESASREWDKRFNDHRLLAPIGSTLSGKTEDRCTAAADNTG